MATRSNAVFPRRVDGTSDFTVTGLKLMGFADGVPVYGVSDDVNLSEDSSSILPTQAAVKAYCDATKRTIAASWQAPVNSIWTTTVLPTNPVTGDRYVSTNTFTASGVTWRLNYIYEYDQTQGWTEITPADSWCVVAEDTNQLWILNIPNGGSVATGTWNRFITSIDHNDLINRGTNTHAQIDTHLAAADGHLWLGQDLRTSASPTFGNITANGRLIVSNPAAYDVGPTNVSILQPNMPIGATLRVKIGLDENNTASSGAIRFYNGGGSGSALNSFSIQLNAMAGILLSGDSRVTFGGSAYSAATAYNTTDVVLAGSLGVAGVLRTNGIANIGGKITASITGSASSSAAAFLQPSLTTGANCLLAVGVAESTNNCALIRFTNDGGAGSIANGAEFAMYGKTGTSGGLRMTGDGRAVFTATIAPGTSYYDCDVNVTGKLGVAGVIRTNSTVNTGGAITIASGGLTVTAGGITANGTITLNGKTYYDQDYSCNIYIYYSPYPTTTSNTWTYVKRSGSIVMVRIPSLDITMPSDHPNDELQLALPATIPTRLPGSDTAPILYHPIIINTTNQGLITAICQIYFTSTVNGFNLFGFYLVSGTGPLTRLTYTNCGAKIQIYPFTYTYDVKES